MSRTRLEQLAKECEKRIANNCYSLDDQVICYALDYIQILEGSLNRVMAKDNLKDRVNQLESRNKALLQELVECATELQCSCGHPACKQCERYKQLLGFIGSCPERNSEGFKTEEFTKEIIEALLDAKSIAMKNVVAARIPECGDFGGIAQNLQYVCEQLGITDT